jgi:hypothetical protein
MNVQLHATRPVQAQYFVGDPERKRPMGRHPRRPEGGINMDVTKIGWGMDWIQLAQDRGHWQAV